MKNPLRFPFAPILLAAILPVSHFGQLVTTFPVEDLLRPAIFLAGVSTLILLLTKFLLRDWHQAGLLTTCLALVLIAATRHFVIFGIVAMPTLLIVVLRKGKMSADGTILINIIVVTQVFAALYSALSPRPTERGPHRGDHRIRI